MNLSKPVFVALDVDNFDKALSLAKDLAPHVGGFKLGPRLTYKYGATIVEKLSELGLVFVDNKYHDIPSTVIAALRATHAAGASFTTVHASHGLPALKEFFKIEQELNQSRSFKILAVTVLTSFTDSTFPANWVHQSAAQHVLNLADQVFESGLSGLVCSPEEVQGLRQRYPGAFLVTPGIRLPGDKLDDQKRVATPKEALKSGASALVIGRPIIDAKDPVVAAQSIADDISKIFA